MDKELRYILDQKVDIKYNVNDEHVFVVGAYTDTLYKEKILVKCLKRLKEFNIPIILCTHFPVIDEIQQLVDHYIFDEKNELLYFDDTKSVVGWYLNDMRYIESDYYKAYSWTDFHHDYAVLTNMRNGFELSKKLGKKKIHYIEYDNVVDTLQYYQTFLNEIQYADVVVYEYDRGSINNGYCAAYIFSIRMEIAFQMLNDITTLEDHFRKNDWRLENYILNLSRKYTNNIKITEYIDNDKNINICYIWNRVILDGLIFFPVVSDENLYLLFNSDNEHLIEIKCDDYSRFHNIYGFVLINIGKYKIGNKLQLKNMGKMFFEQLLDQQYSKYGNKNYIVFKN